MQRSTDRILTTHTGSLPRPPDLIELVRARELGQPHDEALLQRRIREAVQEVVQTQVDCGIDVVSDGEQSKPYYATYIHNRLTGFGGEHRMPQRPTAESRDFPEFAERRVRGASNLIQRPFVNAPIEWKDFSAVEADVSNFRAAVDAIKPVDAFMPAASPGVVSHFIIDEYYHNHDDYLDALANVMRREYEAIAAGGFVVQLDCPDLAMSRQSEFADLSLQEFRSVIARHVEVMNEATKNIPPEQIRIHLCWGNYEGPHHADVPLRDIIDIVFTARAEGISFEAANPRHEHEWDVFQDVVLPDDKVIIPGVVDSVTNFIEHPELVAQRLVRFAERVGKERVIAGTDCGFGTDAERATVDKRIAWAKMESMVQGAALASKQLWGR